MEQLSDLDRLLGQQPQAVREAADDAAEYFQLVQAMRGLRQHRHLKQSSVAEEMSTTQSAVSELESLRTDPQISTLMRYVRAVGGRLHLRATAEDVVRTEGPEKWRSVAKHDYATPRVRTRHLRVVSSDLSEWRVPA
ncbi:helix-turn-helix domain-containing protein [Janibacter alittae]|uniref:helix-turn-helix domain-containing protein n=1 Tax=Janibacter alittae TaxID=3115209 RepID=UPI003BB1AA8C